MNRSIYVTFWIVIAVFVFVMGVFFVPVVQDVFRGPIFLVPIGLFAVASGVLVWLVARSSIDSILKKFMLLAGVSGVGFFVGIILHNLFYAAGMLTVDIVIAKYFFEVLHVAFFLISTILCPIGFLIGAGGSMWYMKKKK
ncbi:MAG: hypothetical protein U9Q12_01225 [Patescibacteria group bacterium]|nr:hypothetical protein [Patescibacteria group bacterium]